WFELFPQLFTDGGARHTAAKHKRFAALQREVALAALSSTEMAAVQSLQNRGTIDLLSDNIYM
ncbi:hypothetical protein ABE607_17540, partial [Comamonas aquatica]